MSKELKGKKVADSAIVTTELIQPSAGNHLGNVFGGKVLAMIDLAGAMVAMRHCRKVVVTASMDRVDFKYPIKVGYLAITKARLNAAFSTSVETEVEIFAENPVTGEQCKTCSALVTYVALNQEGKPTPIPQLIRDNDREEARFRQAEERKSIRDQERRRGGSR
ncbi:MAG: acyl-CoA thioesterase [bacterium]|nr:acyl-CoA thioesterase [bacterium]